MSDINKELAKLRARKHYLIKKSEVVSLNSDELLELKYFDNEINELLNKRREIKESQGFKSRLSELVETTLKEILLLNERDIKITSGKRDMFKEVKSKITTILSINEELKAKSNEASKNRCREKRKTDCCYGRDKAYRERYNKKHN